MNPSPNNTQTSFFATDRERRLWVWTLVVLVGIYSTLGLARIFAGALRDRGLLDATFITGLLLIVAAIVIQALIKRRGIVEIGVILGVVAAYLIVFARMAITEERSHLIEYSVVATLILEALTERASHGRRVPFPPLLAILATGLLGVLDECIQLLIPSRVFDPLDMVFNLLAGVMAVGASVALGWARRRVAGRAI